MSSTLRAHPVVKTVSSSAGASSHGGFTRASDLVRTGEGSRGAGVGSAGGWAKGAKAAGPDGLSSRALAEIHKRSVGASKGSGRQVITLKNAIESGSPSVPPAMAAASRVQAAAQAIAGRAEAVALKTRSC